MFAKERKLERLSFVLAVMRGGEGGESFYYISSRQRSPFAGMKMYEYEGY